MHACMHVCVCVCLYVYTVCVCERMGGWIDAGTLVSIMCVLCVSPMYYIYYVQCHNIFPLFFMF